MISVDIKRLLGPEITAALVSVHRLAQPRLISLRLAIGRRKLR
jgi:hypothetical protein